MSKAEYVPLQPLETEVKPWGTTRPIIRTPYLEQHVLEIKRGGFCSVHYHEKKWQALYVISGRLRMRTFNQAGKLECSHLILRGDHAICPPGLRHQFFAPVDCIATEIYTPTSHRETLDPADIVRLSEGGCDPLGRGK